MLVLRYLHLFLLIEVMYFSDSDGTKKQRIGVIEKSSRKVKESEQQLKETTLKECD